MDKEQADRVLQHKLIEPLVVILGEADLLLEGLSGTLNEKQKERLLKIKEYAKKLETNSRQFMADQGTAWFK